MPIDVKVVSHGRPASEALAGTVGVVKEGHPLAPVTVVVPSNLVGLSVRRLMGSGLVGAAFAGSRPRRGVANVAFVTPFRLAELLAADLLHDRRPLTNPVLGAAVRRALESTSGPFADVARHHATELAFAALYAELSHVSPETLDALEAAGRRAARAVAVHRRVAARLKAFHGEDDMARAAARRPDLTAALHPLGHIIWYLPEPVTPALNELVGAVLTAAAASPAPPAGASVVVALTGAADADAPVLDTCRRAGVEVPVDHRAGAAVAGPGDASHGAEAAAVTGAGTAAGAATADRAAAGITPPVGSHIVSVTDADEEVRAVVRRVAALAEEGVPLDRIGVFHPTPDPYLRMLAQQFAAAGIPANGPSPERLADSAAGRTLLAALALPAERWRRDRVLALVNGAPLHLLAKDGSRSADGGPVRPAAWEELSRRAGVVGGLEDWRDKLNALAAGLDRRVEDAETAAAAVEDPARGRRPVHDPDDAEALLDVEVLHARAEHLGRRRADIDALAGFVAALAAAVEAVDTARGWRDKTTRSRRLLAGLLGPENRRLQWPEHELDAAARVDDALARLATLDEIEPDPDPDTFRRALAAELDVTRGRSGRYGHGVVYGPLAGAVGADLDAVFIVGLAEGQWPAPRRDDALLPDAARALARPGELATAATRLADQHRAFLAALAAAPPLRRHLLFLRGDLRGGRHRLPSRWLLETASALAGTRVYSTDFADLRAPVVDVVASHAAGVRNAGSATPASVLDRDVAAVAAHVAAGGDAARHPVVVALVARSFDCVTARRSERFTKWDGNLAGHPVPSPASGQLLSATSLEAWAACGFRYFLAHILGLHDRDEPERIVELGARERGSGVHTILERFFAEMIAAGVPDPGTPWPAEARARLAQIAGDVFDDLERSGRTGRPLRWRLERQRLAALLDDFLAADDEHRAATRSRPVRVELAFGAAGAPPVEVVLPGGRAIRFKGFADRVDVAEDGTHHISDYKTGKGAEYDDLASGDPTRGGTTLQLGLYSEAAMQLLGARSAAAHYWMVNERALFARKGYPWDAPRRERFLEVIAAIVDGIEAGVFPLVPGEWDTWRRTHDNCKYCPFDDLCPRDRGEFAEAKAGAAPLRIRDVLTAPGATAGEDGP